MKKIAPKNNDLVQLELLRGWSSLGELLRGGSSLGELRRGGLALGESPQIILIRGTIRVTK